MSCQIKITIEEDNKPIFSGSIGENQDWTKLECAFIIRAMTSAMWGSRDNLMVDVGIARCMAALKSAEAAAGKVGISKKTFIRMMGTETNKDSLERPTDGGQRG